MNIIESDRYISSEQCQDLHTTVLMRKKICEDYLMNHALEVRQIYLKVPSMSLNGHFLMLKSKAYIKG